MGPLQQEKAAAIGTAGTGVDSRQYIFSFAIDSLSGIPADFTEPFDLETVLAGVFLPRDDAGWLGRQKYPARVLLLTEREMVVAAHPSAREPLVRVPLGVIRTVECGRILLLGWIALTWDGGQETVAVQHAYQRPSGEVPEDAQGPVAAGFTRRGDRAFQLSWRSTQPQV